jgi:hyperosmotically inducible protein
MMAKSKLMAAGAVCFAMLGVTACDRPTTDRAAPGPSAAAPAPATRPSNPTVGQNIDDATITAKVKAALIAEKGISSADIDVDTSKGVVTLTGRVADSAQVERAAQVARGVDGVTTVQNRLTAG